MNSNTQDNEKERKEHLLIPSFMSIDYLLSGLCKRTYICTASFKIRFLVSFASFVSSLRSFVSYGVIVASPKMVCNRQIGRNVKQNGQNWVFFASHLTEA